MKLAAVFLIALFSLSLHTACAQPVHGGTSPKTASVYTEDTPPKESREESSARALSLVAAQLSAAQAEASVREDGGNDVGGYPAGLALAAATLIIVILTNPKKQKRQK